jgi:hypothetical protein
MMMLLMLLLVLLLLSGFASTIDVAWMAMTPP